MKTRGMVFFIVWRFAVVGGWTGDTGIKQPADRSGIDRSANAFYEIDLVDGIELMCTEMFVQIAGMVLLAVLAAI